MAKKSVQTRKPSGAAAISTIEDDLDEETTNPQHESNGGESRSASVAAKTKRTSKPKADQPSEGNVGVAEIKKAAAFANSIGGLDKAIALLQILKVAKDVQ